METQNVYNSDGYQAPKAEKRFCQCCGSEVVEGCVVCPSCGIYISVVAEISGREVCYVCR